MLGKNDLNSQIKDIILKVPDDHELLQPLIAAYKKGQTDLIDLKYKDVRKKLDTIIANEESNLNIQLENGYTASIIDPTPKESERLEHLTDATGFQYVLVGEFMSTRSSKPDINSCIIETEIYIVREVLNQTIFNLAKHLGHLFIKEGISFENDVQIHDVVVDIIESLS
jgi:hypothetical protein